MAKLIIVIALIALVGCNRRITTPAVVELKDSSRTEVRTEYIIQEVQLPPDSAYIEAYLECDSNGQVLLRHIEQLQGYRVSSSLGLTNNIITVTATDRATKQVERTSTDSTSVRMVEVPVPYPVERRVNYISGWQWFQIWVGRIALVLVLIIVAFKIVKSKFKPFFK